MRDVIFAVLLLVASALIVVGVWTFSPGAALIVSGVLLVGWSWLVLGDLE